MCTQAAISGVGLILNYVCYVVILAWYTYRIVVDVVDIYTLLTAGGRNIVAEVHIHVYVVVYHCIHYLKIVLQVKS